MGGLLGKNLMHNMGACITLIINQSIKSGIFPDRLKIAKVTPIYKKDDKKFIKNYRPISVLPVISKVFETVICDFSSKNLLCSQQYGFRKNSSTELAALEVIDRLLTRAGQWVTNFGTVGNHYGFEFSILLIETAWAGRIVFIRLTVYLIVNRISTNRVTISL